MRGSRDEASNTCYELGHGLAPSPSLDNSGRSTEGSDGFSSPHAELEHLIRELKEFAAIRNTHSRIKSIATRLDEILPDILNAEHRTNSTPREPDSTPTEAQEVLHRHEAIMAELVRVSGAPEEPTNEETSSTGKLIVDLVGHWKAVGAVLGLPNHTSHPIVPRERKQPYTLP